MQISDNIRNFEELSEFDKLTFRLNWLEQKMVEVLRALVIAISVAWGCLASWIVGEMAGNHVWWLMSPVFLAAAVFTGWLAHKEAFCGAPPNVKI